MPRNNSRINQTSTNLLQSWRGNCDVQILIYDSSPDEFDLKEISRVTDYVVAYSCKGNYTLRQESEMMKRMILGMEDSTGDTMEIKAVCKKVMNKAASSRLISKQEACVLLGDLALYTCSDYIENVSISSSRRLTAKSTKDSGLPKNSILAKYASRPIEDEHLSLHQYYHVLRKDKKERKPSIPHFIGMNSNPTYPVSEAYARHVLIVYKPWRTYPNQAEWKEDFLSFVYSQNCPKSASLNYFRVLGRHYNGSKFAEPTSKEYDYSQNPISKDDEEALILAGLGGFDVELIGDVDLQGIIRGHDFKWDSPAQVTKINAMAWCHFVIG
jgi:hypothetical protein